MSLAHFISEAKKNTPVLAKNGISRQKPAISQTQTAEPAATPIDEPLMQRNDLKRTMAEISQGDKAALQPAPEKPAWKTCQYLKSAGQRNLCRQYMSWCAEEKCKQEFMEAGFFDFKKHLKQRKPIK